MYLRGSFIAEAISLIVLEIATSQEHAPRKDIIKKVSKTKKDKK
jgi:hypothetical protein